MKDFIFYACIAIVSICWIYLIYSMHKSNQFYKDINLRQETIGANLDQSIANLEQANSNLIKYIESNR